MKILKPDYTNKIALVRFKTRGNVIPVKRVPMRLILIDTLMRFQK